MRWLQQATRKKVIFTDTWIHQYSNTPTWSEIGHVHVHISLCFLDLVFLWPCIDSKSEDKPATSTLLATAREARGTRTSRHGWWWEAWDSQVDTSEMYSRSLGQIIPMSYSQICVDFHTQVTVLQIKKMIQEFVCIFHDIVCMHIIARFTHIYGYIYIYYIRICAYNSIHFRFCFSVAAPKAALFFQGRRERPMPISLEQSTVSDLRWSVQSICGLSPARMRYGIKKAVDAPVESRWYVFVFSIY